MVAKAENLKKLQKKVEESDFWNDSKNAKKVMKTVTALQDEQNSWQEFQYLTIMQQHNLFVLNFWPG